MPETSHPADNRVALWLIGSSAAMTAIAQCLTLSSESGDVWNWVLLAASVGVLAVAVVRLQRISR